MKSNARRFGQPGWTLTVLLLATAAPALAERSERALAGQKVTFLVRETAGIRRGGYPVSAVLPLAKPAKETERFRLLHKGQPVAAQIQPHGDTSKGIRAISVAFQSTHAPYENRTYEIEYGPNVAPGPEAKAGLKVETEGDVFRVIHSPSFQFVVPRNLLGLLRSVPAKESDYLRPGSEGLVLRNKNNVSFRAGGTGLKGAATTARVVKNGPLLAALHFEGNKALSDDKSVRFEVDMEFPRSRSWVRVTWTVDDPQGYVAALGADLNLNVQGKRTLVDFGAGTLVYAQLTAGQAAALRSHYPSATQRAARSWQALLGPAGSLTPFVVSPREEKSPAAEGWAHVMDSQRCTAVAVDGFADAIPGAEILCHADGRLQVWKEFVLPGGKDLPQPRKTLTFWLHFVGSPVHVGAATSPQSMMRPLEVELRP
jgi:hypothetical protein